MASESVATGDSRPASTVTQFWRVGGGYFSDPKRRLAPILVLVIVLFEIAQIGVQLLLNQWSGMLFDAIETRNIDAVFRQIGVFAGLAVTFLALTGYQLYVKMRIQVEWRAWITNRLVTDWLARGRHHELSLMGQEHDNPDQRISEDVRLATVTAVDFAIGIFHSVLMLVSFVGVLWGLSGHMGVSFPPLIEFSIPGYLVWAALLYAGVGSLLTYYLGRPLVQINEDRLSNEADFRVGLIKVGEGGDGKSAPPVNDQDRRDLGDSFAKVIVTWRQLMTQTSRLSYMTAGYAIVATGLPVLIASPQYFSRDITLGGLMQAVAAFIMVQQTLSWFVDNYPRFADWAASVSRISTFRTAIDDLIDRDGVLKAQAD